MRRSPLHVDLSPDERTTLEHWQRCSTVPNGLAQRVRVVLRFAGGQTIRQVARDLGLARNTAKLWLHRFLEKRLEGFDDLPRSGRPVSFSPSGGHPLGQDRLRAAG
ncbi:MAG: helix-turn-helix domain-containing protein [Planctomycetota bacterium]|nr:helix-turn-helix domain-containing protein [Planctomycetota bacterium]